MLDLQVTKFYMLRRPNETILIDGGVLDGERLTEIQRGVKLATDMQRRPRALQGLRKQQKLSDQTLSNLPKIAH
jgi:hypothetical protein